MIARKSAPGPVIIVGMHRSGTSMVAAMLEELGLFVGWRKDRHSEATLFQRINTLLLAASGGRWDTPTAFSHLVNSPSDRAMALDRMRYLLASPRTLSYLGVVEYVRHRSPSALARPWGWKDPRTTVTLPLWLELFPDARVLHVMRHGVDVASSLVTRNQSLSAKAGRRTVDPSWLDWLIRPSGWYPDVSPRCAALRPAFELWCDYMELGELGTATLGERLKIVRFEDLLEDPAGQLASAATFCGIRTPSDRIRLVGSRATKGRAFAYLGDPQAREFAVSVEGDLRRYGYSS